MEKWLIPVFLPMVLCIDLNFIKLGTFMLLEKKESRCTYSRSGYQKTVFLSIFLKQLNDSFDYTHLRMWQFEEAEGLIYYLVMLKITVYILYLYTYMYQYY